MQATARLSNQTEEPVATLLCSVVGPVRSGIAALFSRIAEHTHSRVLMPVRVRPGQFEFKMRFRSVRFSVSHVSLLIATPQKSRSSRLSDDPRGTQNSFGNESPAVHIPV